MKNTVGRGILFYIFIFLALVCGAACIILSILVFSPNAEIFGVSYFQTQSTTFVKTFKTGDTEYSITDELDKVTGRIDKIKIITNYYNISVENDSTKDAYGFLIEGNTSGLYKVSEQEPNDDKIFYNITLDDSGCLTFKLIEPKAWIFFSKTGKVKFCVPKMKLDRFEDKEIEIETQTGNVVIANNDTQKVYFNSLKATLNQGSISIGSGTKIGYNIYNDTITKATSNSEIITTTGNIYSYGDYINGLKIRTEKGKININKIDGDANIVSTTSIVQLGEIIGNLYYESNKGVMNATKITGSFECAEGTKVSNMIIGEVQGQAILPCAESSNITIKKASDNFVIRTGSGKVIIGEACKNGTIETTSGDIIIVVKSTVANKQINVTTQSGDIEARYKNVIGASNLSTNSGNVIMKYVTGAIFDLNYNCATNAPTVTSGISTVAVEKIGTFYIGHSSTENVSENVTINNQTGKTSLHDDMRADYEIKY